MYKRQFEVFADTLVVCSITALSILTSFDGATIRQMGLDGAELSMAAFGSVYGIAGEIVLAISLCLFAYSTVIGWSYYGNRAISFLLGLKAGKIYNLVFTLVVMGGCLSGLQLVWDIADALNGLMAIPNLIGLFLLSGIVARATKDYFARRKSGRYVELTRTYKDFV